MKLIREYDRYEPSNGTKPYYRGIFECPSCGEHVIKSMSNGKTAKSCGSVSCNPQRIYEEGSRSLLYTCSVCSSQYKQQKRLYEKAKWKDRCPKHRFDTSNLTVGEIDQLVSSGSKPRKYFTAEEKAEARRKRQNKSSLILQCLDCGKAIHRGSTRCRQCSNRRLFYKGKINQCCDCGVKIHRQATRCKPCYDKVQDQGLSKERVKFQNSKAWNDVRSACFERDQYTCQHCNQRGSQELTAHHIKSYRDYPDLRLALENLLTLCKACHYEHHANEKGEERWNTKLTDQQVHQVFKLLISRNKQSDIADKFGVSQAVISNLNTGRARRAIYDQYSSKLKRIYKKGANSSKLTLDEADDIRRMFKDGFTRRQLAQKYQISRTTVSRILKGDTYVDE